jgi:hypothetical protein
VTRPLRLPNEFDRNGHFDRVLDFYERVRLG